MLLLQITGKLQTILDSDLGYIHGLKIKGKTVWAESNSYLFLRLFELSAVVQMFYC